MKSDFHTFGPHSETRFFCPKTPLPPLATAWPVLCNNLSRWCREPFCPRQCPKIQGTPCNCTDFPGRTPQHVPLNLEPLNA